MSQADVNPQNSAAVQASKAPTPIRVNLTLDSMAGFSRLGGCAEPAPDGVAQRA